MVKFHRIMAMLAATVALFSLYSCKKYIITVGPAKKVFSAEASAARMAAPDADYIAAESEPHKSLRAPLTFAQSYGQAPMQADMLDDFAKSLLDKSGQPAVFVNAKPAYKRGETVTLSVLGEPNTVYTLKVRYKSGYSSAKGLGEAQSDERGYVFWTFKIGNASSDGFTPYFEVTGPGVTIRHSFFVGDKPPKELSVPESVLLAPAAGAKVESDKPDTESADAESAEPIPETATQAADTAEPAQQNSTPATPNTAAKAAGATSSNTKPAEPQQAKASIEFVDIKPEYRLSETVTLTVRGAPNTLYTLKVRFKSGYSTAKGLGDAISDDSGYVSWTFKISPNADTSFEPWFEVSGGGATAKRSFKLSAAPATESPIVKPEVATAAETEPPASQAPASGDTIVFVGLRDTYSRGETVTVTVIGKPNTIYTLRVKYKSGYSTAKGLGEAKSDDTGKATWTFKIGNRVDTEFIPSLEVEGGGELAVHYFTVTD